MKVLTRRGLASCAALVTLCTLVIANPAQAYGPPPVFQLPFECNDTWRGATRADHSPNPFSIDFTQVASAYGESPIVTNGSPILASYAGRVRRAQWDEDSGPVGSPGGTNVAGAGWFVEIDHGPAGFPGWGTSYFHMISAPIVVQNQMVTAGQVLGYVGSTGHSSGPHLHYQQWNPNPSGTVAAEFNGFSAGIYLGQPQNIVSKNCGPMSARRVLGDYDGDQIADRTIFRPSDQKWYTKNSSNGSQEIVMWGEEGDQLVPGDYDGNGQTDQAFYRPSTGQWFLYPLGGDQYGAPGDVPVPADYDGDGATDLAVFRPSDATWYVKRYDGGNGNQIIVQQFGLSTDVLVPGNYNGDTKAEFAVWRPAEGMWYINGMGVFLYGAPGDIPVPADYDGDLRTDMAVFRPSENTWYVNLSNGGQIILNFGIAGDVLVPADYNGDRKADIAIWRPSEGKWYINGVGIFEYGVAGDIPLPQRSSPLIPYL